MTLQKVGHCQTVDLSNSDKAVVIHDELYGTHTISEPVLLELLRSPAMARLVGVCQHGISGLLGFTPRITRFEHSVGAFLLVRHVGGSLAEQVAALLHDVSHTAMSHVVDFALSEPGEGSFHEVHKMRFIQTTEIPGILVRHGFADLRPLEEELYPLVEQPAPHLCADRLDYGLRDAVGFGYLTASEARRVVGSLMAHPDATSPHRLLVLRDPEVALVLARAYMTCDRHVWGNTAHGDLYTRTARLMQESIRSGGVKENELWELSDEEFWIRMRGVVGPESRDVMRRLETEALPDEKDLPLPKSAKVRTIDPDIWVQANDQVAPLSTLVAEYAAEKERYITSRRALYA